MARCLIGHMTTLYLLELPSYENVEHIEDIKMLGKRLYIYGTHIYRLYMFCSVQCRVKSNNTRISISKFQLPLITILSNLLSNQLKSHSLFAPHDSIYMGSLTLCTFLQQSDYNFYSPVYTLNKALSKLISLKSLPKVIMILPNSSYV